MKISMLTTAALLAGSTMYAQQAVTEAAAIKQAYNGVKNNLMKAAEKIPEADYSFKATPETRTIAQVIGHVADSMGRYCAAASGGSMPPGVSDKTAKADLVAGLKAAVDVCDGAIENLTDEQAAKQVSMGRGGPRPVSVVLWSMIAHDNEQYGYLSVYMRLKGIVPPSSEGRGGR